MQQNQQQHAKPEEDNPALSKVIERNIHTIIDLRAKAARERGMQGCLADAITCFSGRMRFAYVQILWFTSWILLNAGRRGLPSIEPFPTDSLRCAYASRGSFFQRVCSRYEDVLGGLICMSEAPDPS